MNTVKIVGRRKRPATPEEFHALGAQLDREAQSIASGQRERGFVFKAKSWDELEQWQLNRLRARHRLSRSR
jgi:hypothetical protein